MAVCSLIAPLFPLLQPPWDRLRSTMSCRRCTALLRLSLPTAAGSYEIWVLTYHRASNDRQYIIPITYKMSSSTLDIEDIAENSWNTTPQIHEARVWTQGISSGLLPVHSQNTGYSNLLEIVWSPSLQKKSGFTSTYLDPPFGVPNGWELGCH